MFQNLTFLPLPCPFRLQERIDKKKQEERDREYEKYKKERGEERQRDQRSLPGVGASNAGGQRQGAAPPARGRGRGSVSNLPSWMAKVKGEEGGRGRYAFFLSLVLSQQQEDKINTG